MIRRAAIALVVVAVTMIAGAAPAGAHTLSGVSASNCRSEIRGAPALSDASVRLLDLGRRVELTNHASVDDDVVVLGYDGEPYLRVGPRGTFENRRSPTLSSRCSRSRCFSVASSPQWRGSWARSRAAAQR